MDHTIKTFLEKLGLSTNEIKVYLASLELGESGVTELAHAARVHRVATYAIVENLVQKGLLNETAAKHGRSISANSPRQIQTLLQDKRRQLRKVEMKYEEVLPELLRIHNHSTIRPKVQFYEGIHGLEHMNADIIQTLVQLPEDERVTYSYSNPNSVHKRFEDYVYDEGGYLDLRKQYHIGNKAIACDGEITRDIASRDEEELREMIILPEKQFPYKNDITIYANKIAIQALQEELIGVVIESREIVEDQLAIFQLAWAGAQALNQTNQV